MDAQTYLNEEPETEINLLDICWDLLGQWKAVIIVAIVMAVAIPGLKLLRDNRSYRASLAAAEAQQKQEALPASEAMEQAFAGLTDQDRATVEILVQQQQLIDTQTAYLQNSMLLNTDPTHQRTLTLRYVLHADGDTQLLPLIDAYQNRFQANEFLTRLGTAIDSNAELSYVGELVTFPITNIAALDSNATEFVLPVNIVLPEDVDANTVGNIVESYMSEVTGSVTDSIGQHTVKLSNRSEQYLYNEVAANRKSTLVSSTTNNRTTLKTAVAALSASQKAAFESATSLLPANQNDKQSSVAPASKDAESVTKADAPTAPRFSIKFALVGFVLGIVLYIITYVVVVIVRGRPSSADTLSDCTHSRSLGSVYYPESHGGLSALFHSALVSKHRYAGKGDVSTQVNRIVSTTESVCKHAQTQDVHVLRIGEAQGNASSMAADYATSLVKQGINAKLLCIDVDVEEKALLPIQSAIFFVDATVKSADVCRIAVLCRSYDITTLGNVFVRGY